MLPMKLMVETQLKLLRYIPLAIDPSNIEYVDKSIQNFSLRSIR